jgi:hypothetical protein
MAQYADGKHAIGSCDRCSFEYKLSDLTPQVVAMRRTGYLVCESCLDIDNPQSFPSEAPFRRSDVLSHIAPDEGLTASRDLIYTDVQLLASNVNRIIETPAHSYDASAFRTSKYAGIFDPPGTVIECKTLVYTSADSFTNACDSLIDGAGFPLFLESAKLTVGSGSFVLGYNNDGSVSNNVYTVLTDYDASSVTWTSFNNGGTQGVDFSSDAVTDGTVGTYVVEWDLTDLVQSWLDGTADNKGLLFGAVLDDMGTSLLDTNTNDEYVEWALSARRVIN